MLISIGLRLLRHGATTAVGITIRRGFAVFGAVRRSGAPAATVETLQTDIAAGAPQNPDGTINLVHLGAWLIQEMSRLGD